MHIPDTNICLAVVVKQAQRIVCSVPEARERGRIARQAMKSGPVLGLGEMRITLLGRIKTNFDG